MNRFLKYLLFASLALAPKVCGADALDLAAKVNEISKIPEKAIISIAKSPAQTKTLETKIVESKSLEQPDPKIHLEDIRKYLHLLDVYNSPEAKLDLYNKRDIGVDFSVRVPYEMSQQLQNISFMDVAYFSGRLKIGDNGVYKYESQLMFRGIPNTTLNREPLPFGWAGGKQ